MFNYRLRLTWLFAIFILITVFPLIKVSADEWVKVSNDGFGSADNFSINSMATFKGSLYASTNNNHSGSQVWKMNLSSETWREASPSWDEPTNDISAMAVFKNSLYVGTDGGQLWLTRGQMLIPRRGGGFRRVERWQRIRMRWANSDNDVSSLAVFKSRLYVARGEPVEIWRSSNGTDFNRVINDAFGDASNNYYAYFAVYNNYLYAGTGRQRPGDIGDGAEVWRSQNGLNWAQINTDGFGDQNNAFAKSLHSFNGNLYVGTVNHSGAQIWQYDDNSWSQVTPVGFGTDPDPLTSYLNPRAQTTAVLSNRLYVGQGNVNGGGIGARVWSTGTGAIDDWSAVSPEGLGENTNSFVQALVSRHPYLYASTTNPTTGAQVWKRIPQLIDVLPNLNKLADSLRSMKNKLSKCINANRCQPSSKASSSLFIKAEETLKVVKTTANQQKLLTGSKKSLNTARLSFTRALTLINKANKNPSDRQKRRRQALKQLDKAERIVKKIRSNIRSA